MSNYTTDDKRNCRNCQQPIYFGGVHWWHTHSESSFCSKGYTEAQPDLDEVERVRAAAPELLEACKNALGVFEAMDHADIVCAIDLRAAIAKAEKTCSHS